MSVSSSVITSRISRVTEYIPVSTVNGSRMNRSEISNKVQNKKGRGCCSAKIDEPIEEEDDEFDSVDTSSIVPYTKASTVVKDDLSIASSMDHSHVTHTTGKSGMSYVPNLEGAMPVFSQPISSITSIKIVGFDGSPFSAAVRAVLSAYNVVYEKDNIVVGGSGVNGAVKSAYPDSTYYKVPFFFVNDEYRINDGQVFVKFLTPYLTGAPLSEREEEILTYLGHAGLVITVDSFGNADARTEYIAKYYNDQYAITKWMISRKLSKYPMLIGNREVEKSFDAEEFQSIIRAIIAETPGIYIAGESPGILDYYLFGICHAFTHAKCANMRSLLKGAGLSKWYDSIRSRLPRVFC